MALVFGRRLISLVFPRCVAMLISSISPQCVSHRFRQKNHGTGRALATES